MKKLISIILLGFAVSGFLLQVGYAQSQRPWKIGHVRPTGSTVDKDIARFIDSIAQQTNGTISFEVYAANKLGDYSVVQERVSFGEVEMYLGPFGTGVDKKLSLAFTPFLVDSWRAARRMYSASSPMMKHMNMLLKKQNIKVLGGYPVYFGGIALTEKPQDYADPDIKKNTIIRVPPMRSFELTARALGYTPYPITWMYARMGLKTGMVGGMIGGGAEGYKGLPSIRYYLPVKDHFEYWFVYMNLDLWQSLSAEQQLIISDAAAKMENQRYGDAEKHEKQSLADLRNSGVEILTVSQTMQAKMRDKVRQNVWPVLKKDIGSAFDEVVRFAEKM